MFTVTMDREGAFHIRSLVEGPGHADLVALAEELHRHHYEKRSARPREHDGFVTAFRSAARIAKGVAGGHTPGPTVDDLISAMASFSASPARG